MALQSITTKGRHWENVALPVIGSLTPGSYSNATITVDEYGRILTASAAAASGAVAASDEGIPVAGGPFSNFNFIGPGVTAIDGGGGTVDVAISSDLYVLENGVLVLGGPFSIVNFIGGGVTAIDAGGGQIDVTISSDAYIPNTVRYVSGSISASNGAQDIGSPIDPTATVRTVSLNVYDPFGSGVLIQIEDGLGTVLMSSAQNNPEVVGSYVVEYPGNFDVLPSPQISAVLSGVGGEPTGSAHVEVIYLLP